MIEKYRHSFYPLSIAGKDLQPVFKLESVFQIGISFQISISFQIAISLQIGVSFQIGSKINLGSAHHHSHHLNPLIIEDKDVSFWVKAQTHWLL